MVENSRLQQIFNVFLQLNFLWIGALFGIYTALSYYVAEIGLNQAVLSNQLALAMSCQNTDTMNSSACAQIIESANISSFAIQILGNSSSLTGTSGYKLFTNNQHFLGGVTSILFTCGMITILGFWLAVRDFLGKKSQPHSSQSPQLQPPRRTSTVELESKGHGPAQPGDQPPEVVPPMLDLPIPGLSRQSNSNQVHERVALLQADGSLIGHLSLRLACTAQYSFLQAADGAS